jgi:hypothetical protein
MSQDPIQELWSKGKEAEVPMAHQEIVELLRPQVLRTRWLFPWHLWFYIAFLAAVLWVDVANLVGYWTNPVLLAVQAGVTALTIGLLVYTGFVLRQAYGLARLDDDLASVVRRRLRFFEGQYGLWLWLAAASVALASWAVSVSPASTTIPPIVNALTGLWRGMVRMCRPSDITTCFPSRTTLKPAFSSARTA